MATAALIVSAVVGVASVVQQRKIGKEQRRQNRVANKIAAQRRTRDIRRAIAANRIQQGQAQALGFQLGVGGGTAVQGATQGLQGDLASSIGFSNLQFTIDWQWIHILLIFYLRWNSRCRDF